LSEITPKDIRDSFSEYENEWKEIREEAAMDMKYVAGDPWTPADRAMRDDAGRPCISFDEINQYLNQYNNNLRQNKRGIQVIPKGNGANDKDATRRENLIRGIENDSNAQEAYVTMAENAASRSYGYLLLRTEYKQDCGEDTEPSESLFDQKIVIQRVANPDTILLNPGFEKADASDVEDGFVVKRIRKSDFGRKYPNAEKTSFTDADMKEAKNWIGDKDLQIAEYWKRSTKSKRLVLLRTKQGGQEQLTPVWADKLEGRKPSGAEVARERMVDIKTVKQFVTNGIEILEENAWTGSRIPIISCFGKELWFDEGDGPKRHLVSLTRLARDPQMALAYMVTQQMEEAGMTPKTPYIGYEGQFEKSRQQWEVINKQPFAFIEVDRILDATGESLIPLPTRLPFTPNFQAYEIAKDSIRRSIQSAMGNTPLPTAAQRDSEKSGVALERIAQQESIGSFHLTDNFDRALQNLGWQINEQIAFIYDTQSELPIEKADGTYDTLHTVGNTSHPMQDGAYDVQSIPQDDNGDPQEHLHTGMGDFDVTISTGPSYQSQREQASEFVDHLIENWQQLGIPAPLAQKILALGVKLKDIGPIGDAIQELLDPPDQNNLPPAAQAAISQLQAQLQQLQQENAALHMERAGKVLEMQNKIQIEQMKGQHLVVGKTIDQDTKLKSQDLDRALKLVVALIAAKDSESQRVANAFLADMGFQHEASLAAHDTAHEVAQSATDHQRALELGQQQGAQDAMSQGSDQAHESNMAAGDRAQEQSLAASGQAHEQVMSAEDKAHEKSMTASGQTHERSMAIQGQAHEQTMAEKAAKQAAKVAKTKPKK
jgi:hypothetical protein